MTRYVNPDNVRREDQRRVYTEIEKQDHCPFCMENLAKYHKNPIIKEGKYWLLTENQWPYEHVKHQLLAIHKTHIEHIRDLEPAAAAELLQMFQEEAEKRHIVGGGIAMRFGSNPDKGNYGSTVLHLHAHLIEPDLEAMGESESFKFKFGQPKDYKSPNKE